jgi:class 3 adenylate cyclase/ActR/RegA family two-component response regulator
VILPDRGQFKVLVVDDSFITRKLVSEIVVSDTDFVLAGQAENGKAALRLVREVKPDLVLLDIEMPEMSGLEALRRLGLRSPCHVIILSSLVGAEDSKERLEALRLGAAAAISKPSGAISLDLKQKRASEVVATMRRVVGLPALTVEDVGSALAPAPVADVALALRPVLDCCTAGVLIFDRGGTLTQANTAAHALVNGADRAGARLADIFSDFNSGIAEDIWRVAASGTPIVGADVDYARQDGSWATLRLSARLVKVTDADRLIVTLDDMSRERHLQDLLAKTQSGGIAQLMAKGADFGVSGEIRQVSILFSDIRGFTALSERLGGEGTVEMLNEYFSFMADVIHDCGGQIDKYIGDAIMALFGAPTASDRDADRAVAAARGMIGALDLFNERRTESQGPPIRIGIGVATGPVVAGAIGSPDRMNYTVVGDAANLAARLEALTKTYGAAVLVCGETVAALTKPLPMRQVDLLRVKGQETPTAVYEVFVHEDALGDAASRQAFDVAFGLYRKGDFAKAVAAFDEALRLAPDDQMSALLRQRCLHPPDQPRWDGSWIASEK